MVVLYEDRASREHAMTACDGLFNQFWAQVGFDVHWWRLDFLVDPGLARIAADNAREADIIIFSMVPEGDFPPYIRQWIEQWVDQRGDREGLLLGLAPNAAPGTPVVTQKQFRLREIAGRTGLDYVTQVPPQFGALLNSWQNVEARAGQVTAVLDDILNRLPPPPHFGINE